MHKEGSRTKYRITKKIEVIKKDKDEKMSSNFNFFLILRYGLILS